MNMNMNWINVNEQLPPTQQRVLIAYIQSHGRLGVTIGWYVPAKAILSDSISGEVDDEYDEATDAYYMVEQWVDESAESEYHYPITHITHWMPLPYVPNAEL